MRYSDWLSELDATRSEGYAGEVLAPLNVARGASDWFRAVTIREVATCWGALASIEIGGELVSWCDVDRWIEEDRFDTEHTARLDAADEHFDPQVSRASEGIYYGEAP